jgi:hypothetical protein
MSQCVFPDGSSYYIEQTPRAFNLCTAAGGVVQGDPPEGHGCSTTSITRTADAQGWADSGYLPSYRDIAFSQLQLLRDLYLEKSLVGRELIRLNRVLDDKAARLIQEDAELQSEAVFLMVLACHFADSTIRSKLLPGSDQGFRFSQEIYDMVAGFAQKIRAKSDDNELRQSIDFVLQAARGLVGFTSPELMRFLEESADR